MKAFGSGKSSKKWTPAADDKADKKGGIKETSKKDAGLDKKRGLPFKKGGSIPASTVAKIAVLSNMAGKRSAGGMPVRPAMKAPVPAPVQPMMKRGGKVKKGC